MSKILGVRFREIGKISYFVYDGHDSSKIKVNNVVVAETKRGLECGKVVILKDGDSLDEALQTDEKIIRKASTNDIKSLELKKEEEKKALEICKKKILEHKLQMKLIDAEYLFDRSKVIFYFVAESRVDFRNLVKDLARTLRIRIELRQVNTRDEAKIVGGLGPCGRALCCATFLNDSEHVCVKMAKDQGVSLNPAKLTGSCGKLMCCLKYEQETYQDIISKMPPIGATVITKEGPGQVVTHNVIKNEVKVLLENNDKGTPPKLFKLKEIKQNS